MESRNGSPNVNELASIAIHVAPVHVNGFSDTDISASLAYNNHSIVVSYTNVIIHKVHENIRFGRAFFSPLRLVNDSMGNMAVTVGSSGVRVENA